MKEQFYFHDGQFIFSAGNAVSTPINNLKKKNHLNRPPSKLYW